MISRLRIALGRIGESEDDELAYAYHCGNEPESLAYQHRPLHLQPIWARRWGSTATAILSAEPEWF